MSADKQIAEILAKYDENPREATWKVQGTTVILHKALERIAAKADIHFEKPQILRAERDEAVILVSGSITAQASVRGTRHEWSIGEAVITDGTRPGNYRVSGKQAAYPYAMAEKRAKDRVILKLIGLHGLVYSEEEADEFKEERPRNGNGSNGAKATGTVNGQPIDSDNPPDPPAHREPVRNDVPPANDDPFGLPPLPDRGQSHAESKAEYIMVCADRIQYWRGTEAELREWWRSEAPTRRARGLTQADVNELKDMVQTQLADLRARSGA